MNRFAKMKKERIYTLFETLSPIVDDDDSVSVRYVLKKNGNKKESRIFTRNSFSWRSGRDSNPRPHAWQACILTSWTTEPFLHQVTAVTLKCGAKIDSFSYYTIFRPWKKWKKMHFYYGRKYSWRPENKGVRIVYVEDEWVINKSNKV